VVYAIALVALGASMGLLWRKLEQPTVDLAQTPAHPAAATVPEAVATAASAQLLEEKLRASIDAAGNAQANVPQASASPVDLQKRAEFRKKVVEAYPDLATELQLEPEDADRFLDLLARQQMEISELIASRARENRDGDYSDSLMRDIRTMERADDAEQAAMLSGKFPEWLQLQETQLQQSPVDQLTGMLLRQGIGLPESTLDPLVVALAAEQKRIEQQKPGDSEASGNSRRQELQQELRYTSNSRQLLKVASRYLDQRQLDAYAQLLEQRRRTAEHLLHTLDDMADGP
jgi:hypothetical protein